MGIIQQLKQASPKFLGIAPVVLLALTVWREARGQSLKAKKAVVHIMLNRLADPRWPDTAHGVILQPWQFSSYLPDDPNSSKYPLSEESAVWNHCLEAAHEPGVDPTDGANHYHSCKRGSKHWPKWAARSKLTCRIGPFSFYRL